MEVAMEVEDDVFFADLNKQISLLIMDDDDGDDPVAHCPSVSLQVLHHPPSYFSVYLERASLEQSILLHKHKHNHHHHHFPTSKLAEEKAKELVCSSHSRRIREERTGKGKTAHPTTQSSKGTLITQAVLLMHLS
ncbi:hypothetical protein CsSME_00033455 [Camellia sinensis var. sinensis]|uniref:uncharacterized protein LOC114316181 isoform X1 n=1 Tax=Camellia sinensis TaxID=4442 RepID=UPI001036D3AC|nr:uncharacterized protein LOC114316181 isoform X1 [Camellia sinensis]